MGRCSPLQSGNTRTQRPLLTRLLVIKMPMNRDASCNCTVQFHGMTRLWVAAAASGECVSPEAPLASQTSCRRYG